ncbi:hypothetical protein AGLY_005305 [Aphis glycines]|uniref:Uncharacterized protein n=1 Tax=Aphis glycines TaxID=307491 RepID=A0A6G0TYS8_APHGL|nr:hypothetical protein AGLY_005305 [Aphis glycines]
MDINKIISITLNLTTYNILILSSSVIAIISLILTSFSIFSIKWPLSELDSISSMPDILFFDLLNVNVILSPPFIFFDSKFNSISIASYSSERSLGGLISRCRCIDHKYYYDNLMNIFDYNSRHMYPVDNLYKNLDLLDMYSHNILCTSTIRDTFHWHASNKHLYNRLHNDLIHILGHILFINFYIRKKVKQSESIKVQLPISQNCPINPGGQTHADLVGSLHQLSPISSIETSLTSSSSKNKKLPLFGHWAIRKSSNQFPKLLLYPGKKSTFSNSFQKNREKQKKNDGKTAIFTQNQFSTKSIFFMIVIKTNH